MAAPLKTDGFKELLEKLKTFISSDSYKNHNKSILTKEKLKPMLQDVASSLRLEENRHLFKGDDVECIIFILLRHLTAPKTPVLNADEFSDLDISCECLRLLRNCCAGSRDNQLLINKSSQFVQALIPELFTSCLKYSELSELQNQHESNRVFQTLLRCTMQFVGNCVVGCSENIELFWNNLFSLFSQLLSCGDPILRSYTCMVIYNCLTNDHLDQLVDSDHGWSIVDHILVNLSAGDCEWGLYIIQKILTVPDSLKRLWSSIDNVKKALLLDVTFLSLEAVAKDTNQDTVALDTTNILFISELFSSAVEMLLNPSKDSIDMPPRLLCQMLDCLRTSSSVISILPHLQGHPDLVLSSIMLLREVHSPQSQSKDNRFEESLRKTESVYRLKKDIVQLLGNLVYKHTINQDLVRESNGISLIMDQTKIDEANPFIAQWALFAVRNLCENNATNQQFIADMKLQGLADDVTFLQDHGVKAQIINGQILIQPNDN